MNGKVSGFHVTTTCQNLMCTHRQTHTRGYSVPHTWMTGCAVSVGRISPKLDSYNDLRLQLSARTLTATVSNRWLEAQTPRTLTLFL